MNETPYRYTAALAQQIELAWQDRWEEEGTFHAPNPAGPVGRAREGRRRGEKLFVLDMFPYPSGAGLHVGHPLGYIATDVYARYHRMTRQERPALPGLRRLRPARRAVRRADRPAPAQDHRGQHGRHEAPAAPAGAGPRRPPHASRRSTTELLPLDAVDLPADLQLLVRPEAVRETAAAAGPGRSPSWSTQFESAPSARRRTAAAWADLTAAERARGPRRLPAGLHLRGAGQLVPRAWAPCWPTRRSPPTAAPSAATSRSSSAACASG